MPTSSDAVPVSPIPPDDREPLRLRMTAHGHNRIDGAWWPYSRDLGPELADLVDHFPDPGCHIVRALASPPDWDAVPRRIPIGRGYLKVGSFPQDDTNLMLLTTANRKVMRILVVPPSFTRAQGEEALLAASTSGNAHSAADLLHEVIDHPDVDPYDLWSDDGGR